MSDVYLAEELGQEYRQSTADGVRDDIDTADTAPEKWVVTFRQIWSYEGI